MLKQVITPRQTPPTLRPVPYGFFICWKIVRHMLGKTRTFNTQIRSLILYPIELQALQKNVYTFVYIISPIWLSCGDIISNYPLRYITLRAITLLPLRYPPIPPQRPLP